MSSERNTGLQRFYLTHSWQLDNIFTIVTEVQINWNFSKKNLQSPLTPSDLKHFRKQICYHEQVEI